MNEWSVAAAGGGAALAAIWISFLVGRRRAIIRRLGLDQVVEPEAPSPAVSKAPAWLAFEPERLRKKIRQAGLPIHATDVLLCSGVLALASAWGMSLADLPWYFSTAAATLAFVGPLVLLGWLATRRIRKIEAQLADSIDLILGALRSGVVIRQALELVRTEKPAPIRDEFHELLGRIDVGIPAPQAFKRWAEPVGSGVVTLFALSMAAKWDVGGNYSNMLSSLAGRIRDSIRLERRVQALTADAKWSGTAALVLPYLLMGCLILVPKALPGHLDALLIAPGGKWMLFAAAMAPVVAAYWIWKITRLPSS